MSDIVDRLKGGHHIAWHQLRPAFTHAIALALEAEHQAERASNEVQAHIPPAYPPLVQLLADAVEVPF